MATRLEVTADGNVVGNINIISTKNVLQVITNNGILSEGDYLFTLEEIKKMIIKKLSTQKQYEGKNIEVNYK